VLLKFYPLKFNFPRFIYIKDKLLRKIASEALFQSSENVLCAFSSFFSSLLLILFELSSFFSPFYLSQKKRGVGA